MQGHPCLPGKHRTTLMCEEAHTPYQPCSQEAPKEEEAGRGIFMHVYI